MKVANKKDKKTIEIKDFAGKSGRGSPAISPLKPTPNPSQGRGMRLPSGRIWIVMAFFLGGIRSRFFSILIAVPSETPDNKMIIATASALFQEMFYLALFQDTKDILAIGRVIGVGRTEKRVENVLHFVVTQHLSHGNGSLSGHG